MENPKFQEFVSKKAAPLAAMGIFALGQIALGCAGPKYKMINYDPQNKRAAKCVEVESGQEVVMDNCTTTYPVNKQSN